MGVNLQKGGKSGDIAFRYTQIKDKKTFFIILFRNIYDACLRADSGKL